MAKDKGKKKDAAEQPPQKASEPPRLQTRYKDEVCKSVGSEFGISNPMAMPRIDKITLNVNMGRHLENGKLPPSVKQTVIDTLTTISGQKPVIVKAKKSVSNFKLREGMESSAVVTLRRDRMWYFLDRFINLSTPRIKDFRGLKRTAFDRQGNYSTGLNEQGVFPEINMADASMTHGMNVNISFSNSTPKLSEYVLEQLGMPFAKVEEK